MKRLVLILGLIAAAGVCVFLVRGALTGAGVEIDLGTSARFTDEEMQGAADAVLDKFGEFKGCKLLRVWYDEAASDKYIAGEQENPNSAIFLFPPEHVVVLYSDFRSPVRASGGFNPNQVYEGWSWILAREGAGRPWQVVNYGYG